MVVTSYYATLFKCYEIDYKLHNNGIKREEIPISAEQSAVTHHPWNGSSCFYQNTGSTRDEGHHGNLRSDCHVAAGSCQKQVLSGSSRPVRSPVGQTAT